MKDSFDPILYNIVVKRKENIEIEFDMIIPSYPLMKHHTQCKDTYLKYIQFCTLPKRFYINDKHHKVGIKESEICGLCKIEIELCRKYAVDLRGLNGNLV